MLAKFTKLSSLLPVALYRRALRKGVAAAVEHEALLSGLPACRTVVDAGANRGQFALVARRVFPDSRIIAFEPLRGPADAFRAVFADDPSTAVHQHALGSEAGTKLMHVSRRDDSSSLFPMTSLQMRLFPSTAESHAEAVTVERLDQVLSPEDLGAPALLKLDLQGYELEALIGCTELLRYFDYIYCECAFVDLYAGEPLAEAVIAFLDLQAFRLAGVYNVGYAPEGYAVQADFFFCSRLRHPDITREEHLTAHVRS